VSILSRLALAGLLLGMAACSQTGDPARGLPTAGATARDATLQILPLTAGERALRREARALLASRPSARPAADEADAYAEALLEPGLGSGAARYDRIMSDIAADGSRIEAFLASAAAVLAADGARGTSSAPPPLAERLEKTIRINENRRLVRRVRARLVERLDVYRQALGQLVLTEPGRQAILAEEAITDLRMAAAPAARRLTAHVRGRTSQRAVCASDRMAGSMPRLGT
jgi:hypothetical protein